ncbi:AAA family ATPase [Micrococcus luteus]|uniref:AAA family ATPase n=1 Tax=Micrococcus luteus TaxID=1270 RepID=UPI0011AB784D|nr:ATP-binding protein [Micrococcus luteus]
MTEEPAENDHSDSAEFDQFIDSWGCRLDRLELTNFLSYRTAILDFADLVAIVGPNASGKSNLVSALKLLREIPIQGLPLALARRGGYDQLRSRSTGRPYDPTIRLVFTMNGESESSHYDLRLGALKDGKYKVKKESAEVHMAGRRASFSSNGAEVLTVQPHGSDSENLKFPVNAGQSAIPLSGFAGFVIQHVMSGIQTVEINPATIRQLQEPSSVSEFAPDGSNVVSVYEAMDAMSRARVVESLGTIVPGIEAIDVVRLADRETFRFKQSTSKGQRTFYASQMSDGTLRALGILIAVHQSVRPRLLVIEEPEIAIHLGALRTLVDLLRGATEGIQVLLTTHSADIVDSIDLDSLRVVWTEDSSSHIARISEHSKEPVRRRLMTVGELLRADSLDPLLEEES